MNEVSWWFATNHRLTRSLHRKADHLSPVSVSKEFADQTFIALFLFRTKPNPNCCNTVCIFLERTKMANSEKHASSVSSWDSFMNFGKISSDVQSHLIQVYLMSFFALIAATLGVYLHIWFNIGGLLTFLGLLVSIVLLVEMFPYPDDIEENYFKRFGLLMLSSLFQGATTGLLIESVSQFDQRVFVGAALVFVCFLAAAILCTRRMYLYLGALLYSGISIFLWLRFASSIFGGLTATFTFEIYLGLLIFLGYVMVETQMIIKRADSGDEDPLKHSLELVTIFYRCSYKHDHDD